MSFLIDDTPDLDLRHEVEHAARLHPRAARGVSDPAYPDVDVAIVMESTYPYLKGGVSAVVHDIILGNPDLDFGIIHLCWDSTSPAQDLYGMPSNVRWVKPRYLSMREHAGTFLAARVADLRMPAARRRDLAHRLVDALEGIPGGDVEPFWSLYDDHISPTSDRPALWGLLGSRELMETVQQRMGYLDLPLAEAFWLLREFFSLTYAVLAEPMPRARVYHAHTTGYASLLSAAAAREHGTSFFLTEHNLYVRDTVNTLLDREMNLTVSADDYRTFDVGAVHRAWMAWWIEMGRLCYPAADLISYLYPSAIAEADALGSPTERAVVVPNGMTMSQFDDAYEARRQETEARADKRDPLRLAYIARVVPIKGLLDLIDTAALLVERGIADFVIDVCGPTEHVPWYFEKCQDKVAAKGLEDHVVFHGTVKVRELLGGFDLLVLPSYNEGQPIVVLEAMTAGIPTVGTEVGGMRQLIHDDLVTGDEVWGPCGLLTTPGDPVEMADRIEEVLTDHELYRTLAYNARERVRTTFQLHDVTSTYNTIYRSLGGLPLRSDELAESLLPSGETAEGFGSSTWFQDVQRHVREASGSTSWRAQAGRL
ncbi:GT4 family glycosyltransferase PelF [Arsenicicoccus dermatophilus]|uniref:GT4 family glycosyltransferase PelF n=1 Tax=Arsenicicoccus dermatophilus TaxID=1076331 RepID=UPI00391741CC